VASSAAVTLDDAPAHLAPAIAAELFERNPVPMWIVSARDGDVRDVNEAARELCEITSGQLPRTIHEVIDAAERDPFGTWLREAGGVATTREWHLRTTSGELIPIEIRARSLEALHGAYMLITIRDLRPRLRLEEGLRRSQKLEAIGRLAGSIAHDFNNLLTAIGGHADLLRLTLSPDAEGREEADDIKRSVERGTRLTRQLLSFARRQPTARGAADLNASIQGLRPMLERLLGPAVRLELGLAPEARFVGLDTGQLDQVAMNLAINARDAMPDGGRLLIETATVELDADFGRKESGVLPGRYGLLAVSDEGVGLSEEARAHLFEPFFTTKPPGAGTGLGLATVYGIVRQAGGHVAVWSEPGLGTTFRVYVPATVAPEAPPDEPPEPLLDVEAAPARILVVDDEPSILAFMSATLRRSGHRAELAGDGRAGVERFRAHPGDVDLIVTDVLMPGLTGPAMVEVVRGIRSDVPVLFVSGHTRDERLDQHLARPDTALLPKPFTADDLIRAVGTLLARAAAR
jgi:signal transduction histidine kinase/CheY-like chemotaxis protein